MGKPEKADKKPIKADNREIIVLEYLTENEYITNKIARDLLGLADSTTKRILSGMVEKGTLRVEGERKSTKYYLS